MVEKLETDYLVIGSGAMGMAFTDEMITRNPRAHFFLVDKHARAGGHWNDAYGHVSLHQPADFYEVNSEILGRGGAALASGTEVMAYYERVLAKLVASETPPTFPDVRVAGRRALALPGPARTRIRSHGARKDGRRHIHECAGSLDSPSPIRGGA